MDEDVAVGVIDRGTRKRMKKGTSKERKKEVRYSDHDPDMVMYQRPKCSHKTKLFTCNQLTEQDIKKIRRKFFCKPNKIHQDTIISHLVKVRTPKRKRSRKEHGKNHMLSMKYYVWGTNGKGRVCQKLFLSIFGISARRINTIAKNMKDCSGIQERRGGDKRSKYYVAKREEVKKFISKLKGRESHYGRAKSQRIYLSAELSITKLWKYYNSETAENLKVNYNFFSRIFNTFFNIGFGSPASDVCSTCVRMKGELCTSKTAGIKSKIMQELRLHKLRAKQFYKLLKENTENSKTYCFDLQQVQVLPKIPIQQAFYARQLSLYIFCVTNSEAQDPIFYSWLESQSGRGANEISSALHHFLNNFECPPNIQQLRLFADGCPSQNKNNYLVHSLMLWLSKSAPQTLKEILLVFPVRGHSYLPADRVFGRIEKICRKYSFLKSPNSYYELYREVGEVRLMGKDWDLYDMKSTSEFFNRIPGISDAKRFIIKRNNAGKVVLKAELYYRNDDLGKPFQSYLKRGKHLENIGLKSVTLGRTISVEKKTDLIKLVTDLAGENWVEDEELTWLSPILNYRGNFEQNSCENDYAIECDCLTEDVNLRL